MNQPAPPARVLLAAVLAALLASAARADVLVVDDDGPADFAEIQDAVLAASDGDVVLVKPGTYDVAVEIDDVALTIVQDGLSADVRLTRHLAVRNLSAGKQVLLRGLDLDPINSASGLVRVDIELTDDAGSIRIEDCVVEASGLAADNEGRAAATVSFCDDVVFSRCTLMGFKGGCGDDWPVDMEPGTGGDGCFARLSNVAFFDCTLQGQRGGSACDPVADGFAGGTGGSGLETVGAEVFVSGGSIFGGSGGSGSCEYFPLDDILICYGGGAGGPGLLARGSSTVTLVDVVPQGGSGGPGDDDFGPDGPPSATEDDAAIASLAGPARSVSTPPRRREGNVAVVDYEGEPGDVVYAWASLFTGFVPVPAREGVFLLGFPLAIDGLPLGASDAAGALSVDLPIGELGPGVLGVTAHLQVAFQPSSGGAILLGPVSSMVLLDEDV